MWLEVAVVSTLFAVGSILFGRFEEGTPRTWFWAFLVAMLLPALYIHLWWLPRHVDLPGAKGPGRAAGPGD